ncbi:antigen peptide transporter 2 [Hippocampus comes]|uniref:Transporter associated with antigen processing, subunit type t, teleost specific n=1 Tax=Hippocampus comes TaxID=109280 RepID=A0A3Q3DKE0_HIPCM|nr:PREDICTED: antigen peptide transporter 2-like [Hippocampus comes]XP_019730017.1 PREDICTED: antigen peptide transporter 2-like [Hippocampus comes]
MSSVILSGFLLLFVDASLTWTLWSGLLLVRGRGASAAEQWAAAALKWALLDVMTRAVAPKKEQVVLRRLCALLVLLPCLLRSGSGLGGDPVTAPGLAGQLQVSLCSALSCLFWETAFSGGGGFTEEGKVALDTRRLLARLLQQFRPDFLLLTAACGFIILTVACDTLIPLFQGTVIDMLRGGTLDGFYTTLGILACFFVGSCIFSGLRSGSFNITHARLNKRLRMSVFRTVLSQEVLFFQENQPASLCSRLESDVHQLGLTVSLNFNAVLRSSIKTLLMLVAMLYQSRPLTALACVEIPVLAALQRQQVRYHKELKEQKQDSLARLKELSHQSLGGIRTVRSFHGQSDEAQRFHRELQRLQEIRIRARRHKTFFTLLRRLGSLVTKMVMLLAARSLMSGGQLSGGTLLTFLLYRKPMSHNLKEIFVCSGDTLATLGIISKVFSYLDRSPKRRADGHLAPDALRGEIVFQNVTFGYPSTAGDEPALKDVSMVLEAGKVTALVGPSGSGKTSCVGLLKRLYDPQRGDILLDGQPLHAYDNAYLHRKVVSVPQNPVLMRGSLRYNVEYGLEDCDFRQVREVATKIKADRLLAKMEADYDADVGEGGAHLSEGDKQSVALLRALVRQPRVLLLDEATSQMDAHTQHAVLEEVVRCGCTVLMVAHRLRSVERADRVIFMENGVVMEEGTHAQLMAMEGRYQGLRQELSDQRP